MRLFSIVPVSSNGTCLPSFGIRCYSTQPRLFLKPYTIYKKDYALSLNVIKASFGYKKDYLTVSKQGALTLEFIPFYFDKENKRGLNLMAKKVFAISPQNLGVILSITDNRLDTFFNMECSYTAGQEEKKETKSISFSKEQNQKDIRIKFQSKSQEKTIKLEITSTPAEFIVLRELAQVPTHFSCFLFRQYAEPFILGWHTLPTNKIAEDDATRSLDFADRL